MKQVPKPIVWVGSTRRDLRTFPREVRRDIGQALYTAQQGDIDPSAKPLQGFGGGSMVEVVANYRGDTWRAVYYDSLRRSYLRTPRVSEEIEAWNGNSEEGNGPHPSAPD